MIILDGKEYKKPYKKLQKKDLIKNEEEFLNYFKEDLKNYFLKNYIKEDLLLFLKICLRNDVYNLKEFKIKYTKEGELRVWCSDSKIIRWSPENKKRFSASMTGKKRPEHSKKMKIKMLGIDRGDEWRELKRKQNSSLHFKIKRLENLKIEFDKNDEEDILLKYSVFMSNQTKSPLGRINKLKKFLLNEKYFKFEPFIKFKEEVKEVNLNEQNYKFYFTKTMSIISSFAMENNSNMGTTKFFDRGLINVNYCKNLSIIKYRSSWEKKIIELFENEKIFYQYEPFLIEKENGFYKPDFLLNYNGKNILLEIKGFIRGRQGKKNEYLKIKSALKYCNDNNLQYSYCQNLIQNKEHLKLIEQNIINNLDKFKEWQ